MALYRHKTHKGLFRLLAHAYDPVERCITVVFCPRDKKHRVYAMELRQFEKFYEPVHDGPGLWQKNTSK